MAWPIWSLGNFDKNPGKERGTYLQNDHAPIFEGSNAKMHLTMLISGSKHPKNIYNMSKIEVGVEIQFKFEFKFKLELKQKRKRKEKENREGTTHLGWPRPKAQLHLSTAQLD